MEGETDLRKLIARLQPRLHDSPYVFASVDDDYGICRKDIVGMFREIEGLTLILKKSQAEAYGLSYSYVAAQITLEVHSSLAAVGLTACVANSLAQEQISCNLIAAYHHDHVFVKWEDADRALTVLKNLSKGSKDPLA